MARKYYSICVNDEKHPELVEFLEGLTQGGGRNGYLVELLLEHINKDKEELNKLVTHETDPLLDRITNNLEINTQLLGQMQNTMQMFCNMINSGVTLGQNISEMALGKQDDETIEREEISLEVLDGVLGGW